MKLRWVNGLRGIVALALLAGATQALAQNGAEKGRAEAQEQTQQQSPQVGQEKASSGEPVLREIRVVAADGKVLATNPSGLELQVGKPVERDLVAQSLRTLYRTGNYSDLRAVVTPYQDGVRLDFVVRESLFFNQVIIQGLVAPPSDASAAAAMQLTLGQPYREYVVEEGLERLRTTLREEGLYAAKVTSETIPHNETHQMDVVVHIASGPRARVNVVRLKNGTEFRDSDLLSRLKVKPGRALTSERLQRGTDRIRKFLVKKGHLSARALIRRGEYDAATNSLPLDLEVTEGPKVKVVVAGVKFSSGEIKRLVPVYQEGAVDADLLEEGKRNIRERLERDGYFDAQVDYSSSTNESATENNGWKGTEQTITYRVDRGERHELVGIEISGNHYFDTELLRSRLQIYAKAFAARGRFSRRLAESDGQSMKGLYISNGFLDAKVDTQIRDDYRHKTGDLFIHFEIEEGKQTRVASLSLEGVHAFKQEELLGVIDSTVGQPYSDFNVATDRDNILALYFNEGFPDASFTSTAESVKQPAEIATSPRSTDASSAKAASNAKPKTDEVAQSAPVNLVYRINEGPQIKVRRVLIAGYVHTRPRIVRREVQVEANEPLRQGDVVESQRRLYNLGVFNRVTIEPQNPGGTDAEKDIVVLVEEAKRYTVAYGGGFEVQRLASTSSPTGGELQAAPRGILELSKLNLTGRGDSLSLKIRGSTLQGRALLGYTVPNAFNSPHFSFQATAYAEKTRDINTFTEQRYEGTVQLTQQVTRFTTVLYRYSFRKVLISNLNSHVSPGEIPLFEQPTLVSQAGVTWIRDTRDNPADASKGTFNSVDLSDADTKIGSSASFLRLFLQNSTYHPIKRRFSFARSIRFGILLPYRDTVSLTFPAPTTPPFPTLIPLPERFFAGGGTSLRGFALNQAGPRDSSTGFPVGGQALLVTNQEFRFPMRLPFVGSRLGGAIFYDGGNVYSRVTRISFRSSLPRPTFISTPNPLNPTGPPLTNCVTNCSNELNYFAHTVGFGVRYATPVGPIRIDLGYQINRPFFVEPCVTPTTTTVTAPACFKGTQLPRLQVFFNLGSSF